MPRMPDFEAEISRELGWFEKLLPHHAETASETPASEPETTAAAPAPASAKEDTMPTLSQIAADIRTAIGNSDQWVKQVTETHLPAIVATAQKYETSPICQALENAFLPPSVEQSFADMINELAKTYPAQPAAAPVTDGTTAQPQQPDPVPAAQ